MKTKQMLCLLVACCFLQIAVPTNVNAQNSRKSNPEMTKFFKSHIDDYPSEFGLFKKQPTAERLKKVLGQRYREVDGIYQTQVPIEFRSGMFFSYGFQAHNCCDPILLWAYDSRCDAFYVYIKKDDREYYYSETGKVPYEFKELVDSNI